jgi:epsilon-lactone hydrolase
VLVAAVTAGGVPAYWLDAPGVDPSQVLVFVHG